MSVLSLILISLCSIVPAEVNVGTEVDGRIKLMNAVNNGPVVSKSDQVRDNFKSYMDCSIPYARTHDAAFESAYGGEHTVDISAIFTDFSKDVNDPVSYDFALTDCYLGNIRAAGTQVFFRLGQKIEHNSKKYNILPPADYHKWAEICEHVIRHYNEDWADGFHWDIRYWEIWNEPDLDMDNEAWKINPRTWGGSSEEFFKFYSTVALHLKKQFPELKIGGPAIAHNEKWAADFLTYMSGNRVALDFFSWHIYDTRPDRFVSKAESIRKLLDGNGYGEAESILDEWNYIKDWTGAFQSSINTIMSLKGAAFVAAVLQSCQNAPVDMLMYYDARPSAFNGLFDYYTYAPLPSYYVFYAWNKLLSLGNQLPAVSSDSDVYVTAASDGKGRSAILVSRYNDDNNVVEKKRVRLNLGENVCGEVTAHLTDSAHLYTEIPVSYESCSVEFTLEPNSFIIIETR